MKFSLTRLSVAAVLLTFGCQRPSDTNTTGQQDTNRAEVAEPDPVPSGSAQSEDPSDHQSAMTAGKEPSATLEESEDHARSAGSMMRGGPGRMGRGPGAMSGGMNGMSEDMSTLHAMFDGRGKIKRTIKNLPNGAETLTESDDDEIVSLLQEHVPAMEGRVNRNEPLPPMTFHPIFKELIKHADDITFEYEETDRGIKVTYTSSDENVVLVIQEHAKLVSRFVKNGMDEIHKPYTIPKVDDEDE